MRPFFAPVAVSAFNRTHNAGKAFLFYALLVVGLSLSFSGQQVIAQNVQHTRNTADESLKSDLRVDPSTLGLNITIPLGGYAGRGGLSVPVGLRYSSKGLWHMEYSGYYQEGTCCAPSFTANPQGLPSDNNYSYVSVSYGATPGSGWGSAFQPPSIVTDFGSGIFNFDGDPCAECELNQQFRVQSMRVLMPDGSTHELRRSDTVYTSTNLPQSLGTYVAVDGSRLRYVEESTTTGTLYLPDGSRYLMGNQANKYIDRNGNTLVYNANGTWTDTLGRSVGLVLTSNPPTPTSDQVYALTGVGGVVHNYIFRYKYLSDAREAPAGATTGDMNVFGPGIYPGLFHSEGGTRVTPPAQFNPAVLTEIELPDGGKYKFSYNEYGEVDKVVYPTGGYERYLYAVIPGLSPVNEPYAQTNRGVVDRWVSPSGVGNDEQHTHYAIATSPEYKVTITNPDNSYTEQRLQRGRGPGAIDFGFDDSRAGMAYDERVFSSTGQMLRRKLTEWSQSGPQAGGSLSATATRDPRVTKEVEIILDTGGNALTKTTAYQYDADLNLTATSEHDFAQVSQSIAQTGAISSMPVGTLLRTSETTFLVNDTNIDANARAAYRARNMLSLPTSSRVRNAAGTIVSQGEIKYDESNYPLVPYGAVTSWTDPATTVRGNATTSRSWLDTSGAWVETHAQYDQCGSPVNSWDAKGNLSQVSYSALYAHAYPTQTISPVPDPTGVYGSSTSLVSTTAYDFSTGRVTSTTDANGQTTSFEYNDPFSRLTKVNQPDGGRTTNTYVGVHQCGAYVRTRTLLDSSGRETDSYQFFDGLGRAARAFTYENQDAANQWLTVDTQYDALGRAWRSSNAYRSAGCTSSVNPSGRWTETTFDALGRATQMKTTADNAKVLTAYEGNRVLVTDQAGKKRISRTDAMGRLTDMWEVTPADAATVTVAFQGTSYAAYPTSYIYDVLGNLRKVDQGGQVRFFMYDSLSRLIRAKNPEQATNAALAATDPVTGNGQWSLSYTYDSNGNLNSRVDARGVTANYTYDNLNRNTTVTYQNDPSGTLSTIRKYDSASNGKGRPYLVAQSGSTTSATYFDEYDSAGRLRTQRQKFETGGVWSADYKVSRTYDLAGNVLTQTYPSGRTVSYGYDVVGRVGSFTGNLGDGVSRTYATGVTYSETGGVRQEQFGTQTPLYHKMRYNARGQLYDIRLGTVNDADNWNRGMLVNHYGSGDFGAWGTSGPNNNGNVLRSHHYVPNSDQASLNSPGSFTVHFQDYEYDTLSRLSKVTEMNSVNWATQYVQKYDYDRWGNRTINAAQTWGVAEPQFELQPQSNQEVAEPSNRLYAPGDANRAPAQKLMRYDAAGNLIYDAHTGQGTRVYDAENRMTSAQDTYQQWSSYAYDADGRRVKRITANQEWWQVYGAGGELVAEYRANAAPMAATKEYGYRGGELLVTMASGDDQRVKRFVTNLYYGALQRDPTSAELSDKSNQLATAGAQGQTQLLAKAKEIARSLFTSTAYETSPYRSDTQYVADLYYTYLQRAPDDSGLNWWAAQVPGSGRSNVCNAFEASSEFATLVNTLYGTATSDNERTERFVNDFYLGAYGRNATSVELQQQRDTLNVAAAQGQSQVQAQAETMGRTLFASQVTDFSITAQQFVTNLYEGFLQRGPDAGGLSFWTTQAGSTSQARQNVLNAFATSGAFRELSGTLYRETFWLVSDHLGTPRMVVDKSGSLVGIKRHDYLPFGEELLAGTGGRTTAQGYGQSDGNRKKWAQLERDGETGLDYAKARYYSPMQGRFISVDPENADAEPEVPQSWNGYAYARNNPQLYTDPTGEKITICGADGKNCYDHTNKDFANLRRYCEFSRDCKIADDRLTGGRILQNGVVIATFANELDGTQAGEFVTLMNGPAFDFRTVLGAVVNVVSRGLTRGSTSRSRGLWEITKSWLQN